MDRPGLDLAEHRRALRGLARINSFSGSARILWPCLRDFARRSASPVRVLDIASGAGDVPIRLAQRATRAALPIHFTGCDISATAIEHASRAGAGVSFTQRDVLRDGIPQGVDVVTCSLFLHHLDEADALRLFTIIHGSSVKLALINDLSRSRVGYVLAAVGTRLLSRSPVVHIDGPRSVRAAFTPAEAIVLTTQAGWHGATVQRRWPCRFLIRWER